MVKLLFGGDFAPIGTYEKLIANVGGDIWGDARDLISEANFSIINLEIPLCANHEAIAKVGPSIKGSQDVLKALTEVGINAVSIANNHIFDFGLEGLTQTLTALEERDIKHVGAGFNQYMANKALRIEIDGRKVSIFAFAEQEFNVSKEDQAGAALLNPLYIARLILDERKHADAIIISVHAGNEYFEYPRPGLRQLCHFLIDVGADAVVGHHSHVPGAYEIYRNKPIVYSLGNLIFNNNNPPPKWNEGYFAQLNLDFTEGVLSNIRVDLFPYVQSVEHGGIQLLKGERRIYFLKRIESMREDLEIRHEKWIAAWDHFVFERMSQTLIDLSCPIRFRGLRRLMKFKFFRLIIMRESQRLHRLNLLRCVSHRELTISVLSQPLDCKKRVCSGNHFE